MPEIQGWERWEWRRELVCVDMSRELHAGQMERADGMEDNTEGNHLEENECL